MKHIRLITRADDAGNSHSANHAMTKVIHGGLLKNISVMAPGGCAEEAARMFGKNKTVCFGMHGTLNAEWDRLKWGPVSDLPLDCELLDAKAKFHADPKTFLETKPALECILKEYNAQLDKLTRLGFTITYYDSHMLSEKYIPGMDEMLAAWAREKGLLDHMYFYAFPPGFENIPKDPKTVVPVLRKMPDGQYFFVMHPTIDTAEFRAAILDPKKGKRISKERNREAVVAGSPLTKNILSRFGVTPIRYDEAVPNTRMEINEICRLLGL